MVLCGVSSAQVGLGAGSGAVERKGAKSRAGVTGGTDTHNISQSLVVAVSQAPLLPGR